MKNTFTFNSAKEIYDTIMSGQDLYCLDTSEFFTMFDDMYIAIYQMTDSELRYYAKKFDETEYARHIDDAISELPTEVLEPNIITEDGEVVSPEDSDYEDVDGEIDGSNIIEMLSDLVGKQFINADIESVWNTLVF